MPEEPIIPVIRRPEKRRGSEGSLDRERRIAREVREGRERFERKSADREEKKPNGTKLTKERYPVEDQGTKCRTKAEKVREKRNCRHGWFRI